MVFWKKRNAVSLVMIILSALLSAFAYQSFASPCNLYPAGFMGLAVLISQLCERFLSLSIHFNLIYCILNLLATVLVLKAAGRRFLLLSVLQYLLTSFLIAILPPVPLVEGDYMLLAVFGGSLAGASCLLALGAGASSGGADFMAIYFSARQNSPAWFFILYFNWFILMIAGINFGMKEALYSIIYQTIATCLISYMHNRYKLVNIQIITTQEDKMLKGIFDIASHGVTKFSAQCGYSHEDRTSIVMIASQFETEKIVAYALSVDSNAFISVSKVHQIYGNFKQARID